MDIVLGLLLLVRFETIVEFISFFFGDIDVRRLLKAAKQHVGGKTRSVSMMIGGIEADIKTIVVID